MKTGSLGCPFFFGKRDMRRLIITSNIDQKAYAQIAATIVASEALRKLKLRLDTSDKFLQGEFEVAGELAGLSDNEIETITAAFSSLANETLSVFEFHAMPAGLADAAMCTLHPNNEMDAKVVSAFLKEMFGT